VLDILLLSIGSQILVSMSPTVMRLSDLSEGVMKTADVTTADVVSSGAGKLRKVDIFKISSAEGEESTDRICATDVGVRCKTTRF